MVIGVVLAWKFRGNDMTKDSASPPKLDGHAEMLAVLKNISIDPDHQYFGDAGLVEIRSRLSAVPPGGVDEFVIRFNLGLNELQLGQTGKAIDDLRVSYALAKKLRGQISPMANQDVTFNLAVAYMRLGENENCVNCRKSESCIFPLEGDGVHEKKEGSKKAIGYLSELLRANSEDTTARWLLNLAHMTLGTYPEGVPERDRIAPETFDSDEEFPRFKEIAPRVGLSTRSLCGGAIADDFNDDGLLDIVTSNWDTKGQLKLLINTGDGKFVDRTKEAGLTGIFGGLNVNQADYNNDGHTDIFVMRGAWLGANGRHPNSLLRNNGDGTFTDVTFDAGLAKKNFPTQTASWADYNNDGRLDLYVGNETIGYEPAPSQLFHNNGDGTFTDVAARAGVRNDRYAKAVIWGDYDGDDDPDLYVSNYGFPNRLYRNNGDGTFTDVALRLGVDRPQWSFPSWFWDYNNDGALDIFVSSYRPQDGTGSVAKSYLGLPFKVETARLYQGDGKGGFRQVAREQKLTQLTLPMGSNFGDLDNDGFLDFYLAAPAIRIMKPSCPM